MSGLEVLGIVAAAAQFTDAGWKVVLSLSRLVSDLNHASRKVKNAARQLQNLIEHVDLIRTDIQHLAASDSAVFLSDDRRDLIAALLGDCTEEAGELNDIVKRLTPDLSDGRLRISWKAVVSVKKEKDILERCVRLESLKSSLSLWFGHRSLVLLQRQHHLGELTLKSTKPVEDGIDSINTELDPLRNQINEVAHNVKAVQSTMLQVTDNFPERTELSPASVSRLAQQLCLRLISKPSLLQEASEALAEIQNEEVTATRRHIYAPEQTAFRPPVICTCRHDSHPSLSPLLPISFYFQSRESRGSRCPSHKNIEQSRTYIIRASLLPVVGKAIQITFTANSGGGGYSLSSGLRIIDAVRRSSSPAFALFDSTCSFRASRYVTEQRTTKVYRYAGENRWYIWEWDFSGILAHLKYMIVELQRLFSSGRASASDQDENGRTLLHEVTLLAIRLELLQSNLLGHLTRLVEILVSGGVDTAAIADCQQSLKGEFKYPEFNTKVDALSIALSSYSQVESKPPNPRLWMDHCVIDHILLQNGCEILDDANIIWTCTFEWEREVFPRRPVLAEMVGYKDVTLAVLQRSETDLRALLRRGFDPNGEFYRNEWTANEENDYSPIEDIRAPLTYARGWPAGMKILLEAGADPYLAIHDAIQQEDYTAVAMLLDHDCPLFPPSEYLIVDDLGYHPCWPYCQPVLAFAIQYLNNEGLIRKIINLLVDQRQRLREVAKTVLSVQEQSDLGLNEEVLLDSAAMPVHDHLLQNGFSVPISLRSYGARSVYHLKWLPSTVAEQLYEAGFHSVDLPDDNRNTPVLLGSISESRYYWDFFTWLLHKGAVPFREKWGLTRTLFHFIDKSLSPRREENGAAALPKLLELCGGPLKTDDCNCYCSSHGCTMIHTHFKGWSKHRNRKVGWEKTQEDLQGYLMVRKDILGPLTEEVYYNEVCRLEIFERFGMAHTCCDYVELFDGPEYRYDMKARISDEDRLELQDEDEKSHDQLEALMESYKCKRDEHSGPFNIFWYDWWATLDSILPEKEDMVVEVIEGWAGLNLHEIMEQVLPRRSKE